MHGCLSNLSIDMKVKLIKNIQALAASSRSSSGTYLLGPYKQISKWIKLWIDYFTEMGMSLFEVSSYFPFWRKPPPPLLYDPRLKN